MNTIDVIIPCYRYGQFLKQCVESVLSQNISRIRILIIDDESPDDTPLVASELVKSDSRIHYYRHETNKGHIFTYNKGIDWASAKYFLLLSADDYLLPGALRRAITILDQNPAVGFCYGKAMELYDTTAEKASSPIALQSTSNFKYEIFQGAEYIKRHGCNNEVPTATAIVRTELQKKIGHYQPSLPHSGDMEMWLRLASHASVAKIDEWQAVYRRHAANMSTAYYGNGFLPDLKQRRMAIESFLRSTGPNVTNSQELRAEMLHSLSLEAISLASSAFNDGSHAVMEQLLDFANETCSRSFISLPRAKLAVKKLIGRQGWALMQGVRSKFASH
jgi:hypothetical protein